MSTKYSTPDSLQHVISGPIERGDLAGAAALRYRPGTPVAVVTAGVRDLVNGAPVERDTIFRIASMTKPVTAVAALTLFDEGRFQLDEPITTCAPEFSRLRVLRDADGPLDQCDSAARPITFGDLLSHRSGLTYGELHRGPIARASADALGPQMDNPLAPDEWISRLAALPLIDQPGANFHYGQSSDLLGFLISRLEGAPLASVLARRVFEPLGMRDTGFRLSPQQRQRRAGLSGFDHDGRLIALPSAPGGHAIEDRPDAWSFESGGQGLWSTLDDYLAFARMLIDDPAVPQLLRPETRRMMTSNQLTPEQRATARLFGQPLFQRGHGYGFGVAVVDEPGAADVLRGRGGAGTISWPGAYGGWWQADPNDGSVLIFLTHSMAELSQLAKGIGLGAWTTIAEFHAAAAALSRTGE